MILGINDPVYFRFLAVHAGIWPEIGVLEDARVLRRLRRERCSLGLPVDRWLPPKRPPSRRRAAR